MMNENIWDVEEGEFGRYFQGSGTAHNEQLDVGGEGAEGTWNDPGVFPSAPRWVQSPYSRQERGKEAARL